MLLLDKIIIAILFFFFLSGWLRGFLKSMIGPVSFLLCFISAVIFYDLNRNILMAVLIATVGTIALAITFNVLLALGLSTVHKEFRGKTFLLSRLLGSLINIFWQGNIFFVFIIIFSTLPINNQKFESIQKQITESKIVSFYYEKVVNRDNRIKAVLASFLAIKDPNQMQLISNTKEFTNFYNHAKVQKFLNDPQVIDALAAKDSVALLSNPALKELVIDDDAMYNLTILAQMVYTQKLKELGETPQDKPRS